MSLIDHHDLFTGSTRDGWTFIVVNRPIPNAAHILTGAGFTARTHRGRTLYLLPPEKAKDAHAHAGPAIYGLMTHTVDVINLAWTTREDHVTPAVVTICFTDTAVTATVTAATGHAEVLLTQLGFTATGTQRQYALPAGLAEHDALIAVVRAEAYLLADDISVHVDLGIATVQDIPPAPSRPGPVPAPPATPPVKRHSR
ncbi:hypothetical protein OK074_4991 [Actinobacteria bacterium OK074]|nr:hypothetical protein OK074_4991 [Actinobacteria bacterium OK074]